MIQKVEKITYLGFKLGQDFRETIKDATLNTEKHLFITNRRAFHLPHQIKKAKFNIQF